MGTFLNIFSSSIISAAAGALVISGVADAAFLHHGQALTAAGMNKKLAELANYKPDDGVDLRFSDGEELDELAPDGTRRIWTPISSIPALLQDGFIAAEDATFWTNPGVDVSANVRSALSDIQHFLQKRPAGASTITQQVIKNTVMAGVNMNISGKIDEFILALRAGSILSKQKILEIYLNQIYLGSQAYGVTAAAHQYFNKPLADLTVAQIATLAGIPKSPTDFNPKTHPSQALKRRGYVLGRMLARGMIDKHTYDLAMSEALLPASDGGPSSMENKQISDILVPGSGWIRDMTLQFYMENPQSDSAAYSISTVDRDLEAAAQISLDTGLMSWDAHLHGWHGVLGHVTGSVTPENLLSFLPDGTPDWSEVAVVTSPVQSDGSLSVETANGTHVEVPASGYAWLPGPPLLRVGDVILIAQVEIDGYSPILMQIPENGLNGSIIVMDAVDGSIEAVAGGFAYKPGDFNRATQAERQAGSTVKPFIYLAAMEDGFTPDTPVLDLPIQIKDNEVQNSYWEPTDDDDKSMGVITTRQALIYSRNMAAVRVLWQVGLDAVSKVTSAFGLYSQLDDYSDALGAKDVTPLKMAIAYAELINGGWSVAPHFIKATGQTQNDVLPIFLPATAQVAPAADVAEILDILDGVTTEGTASNLSSLAKQIPIGGKTGTSDSFKDAWFAGYANHRLSIVVQVGFDQPASLGKDGFGATVAAPIFQSFVQNRLTEIKSFAPISAGTPPSGTH